MSNNRPLDCQTTLQLPIKQSLDYGYGLLNNVITLKIPIKNMDLKIELNIKIGDIFKMDIKEISVDQDSFETEVKKFLIKDLQKELNDN